MHAELATWPAILTVARARDWLADSSTMRVVENLDEWYSIGVAFVQLWTGVA